MMSAFMHRADDWCVIDLIVVLAVTVAIIAIRFRSGISK